MRNLIVAASLAVSPVASGVKLADDGTGDALIFPAVFSESVTSLVTVTSTDQVAASLVRLTLRQGLDGSRVAGINLLLAPGASAAAGLFDQTLLFVEPVCIDAGDLPRSDADGRTQLELAAPVSGFLEAYETATVEVDGALWEAIGSDMLDCTRAFEIVNDRASRGLLLPPRGVLGGSSFLIAEGASFNLSIAPTVLEGFRDEPLYRSVDEDRPTLADASPAVSVIRGAFEIDGATVNELVATWDEPIDAVSALLTHRVYDTEFSAEVDIDGRTDVVLTLPTRHFYVGPGEAEFRAPFANYFRWVGEPEPGQQILLAARTRTGRELGEQPKCTPRPHAGPVIRSSQLRLQVAEEAVLPGVEPSERAVVQYFTGCLSSPSELLADEASSGKIQLDTDPFRFESREGFVFNGLPLIPVSVTAVRNGALALADGTRAVANYGLVNPVRPFRDIYHPVARNPPSFEAFAGADDSVAASSWVSDGTASRVLFPSRDALVPEDDSKQDGDIYLVDAGGEPRLLSTVTAPAGRQRLDFRPALSRDGTVAAWLTCEVGAGDACLPDITVMAIDSGASYSIQAAADLRVFDGAALSADGSIVAFIAFPELVTAYDARSGTSRSVSADEPRQVALSPDGDTVWFRATNNGQQNVFAMERRSGTVSTLLPTDLVAGQEISAFRISDDGSIAAVLLGPEFFSQSLVRVDLATGAYEVLNRDRSGVTIPAVEHVAIDASGDTILFSSFLRLRPGIPTFVRQVYLWTASSGRATVLSLTEDGFAVPTDTRRPGLSADGSTAIFFLFNGATGVDGRLLRGAVPAR